MSTADREKKRRVSYFVGLNDCDDSENENENDKNKKEQEEIYGWDLFRFIPLKAKTGSMVETRLYELCLQIIRVIAYASIFTIVIVSGVIAKTTILFAISQLERKDRLIYCEYNEYEKRSEIRQLLVNVPEEGRITWYWCVVLAFCTPEMLAVIGAIYDCLFKKKKLPYITAISIICITDGIHSAAMAVFFLVILPKLNSILALSVSSFMHLIPSLLGLLACCKFQRETKRKSIMRFIFKTLLLVIQTGGVVLILLLSEIDNETCWILPCILLLCSLRWWPNYVTGKSDIGFIRYLNSVQERLKLYRGYEQGITAILRISTFFSASILIVYYKNININKYLSYFPGRIKYNIILSSSINNGSDFPQNNITEETAAFITVDSSMLLVVLFSHALSSFVLYSAGKFAVKTLMQRFGFALPLSLVTSVSFIVMIIVCILRENNPCAFHGLIGDYLFFTSPKINVMAASFLQWQCLLWLLILLSQVWTTVHIWTSYCERLATTHRIFALPFYDSLIIDQSLMLNRRKDNFHNHKKSNKVLSSVFNKYMF